MDKNKDCFLCLTQKSDRIEIFSTEGQSKRIAEIINQHFWFELKQSEVKDLISICLDCWQQTLDFHEFYCRVENIFWTKACMNENCGNDDGDLREQKVIENVIIHSSSLDDQFVDDVCKIEPIAESDSCDSIGDPKYETASETNFEGIRQFGSETSETEDDNKNENTVNRADLNSLLPISKSSGRNKAIDYNHLTEQMKIFFDMKCTICSHPFDTYNDARLHTRSVHNKEGYLHCCKSKVPILPSKILEHIQQHTNPVRLRCSKCNRTFARKMYLRRHMRTHADPSYFCDVCGKGFHDKSMLLQHLRSAHYKSIECKVCHKMFGIEGTLQNHIKRMHQPRENLICDECGVLKFTLGALVAHKKTHLTPPGNVKCDTCGKFYKTPDRLKRHIRAEHIKVKTEQTCEICGKKFLGTTALRGHIDFVHKEKKHKCHLCKKAFHTLRILNNHIVTHTGEALNCCAYCPKKFVSRPNMFKHRKRKHLNEWLLDKQKESEEMGNKAGNVID